MSLEYISTRDRPISDDDVARLFTRVSALPSLRVLNEYERTLYFDDHSAGEELGRLDVEEHGVYLAFRGGTATWNQAVREAVQAILNELGAFSTLVLE